MILRFGFAAHLLAATVLMLSAAPQAGGQGIDVQNRPVADIQIKGVSKWELATYLRSLPERGGVGTYCHTASVHIDIGPQRDWNWRCRRKK